MKVIVLRSLLSLNCRTVAEAKHRVVLEVVIVVFLLFLELLHAVCSSPKASLQLISLIVLEYGFLFVLVVHLLKSKIVVYVLLLQVILQKIEKNFGIGPSFETLGQLLH